MAGDQQAAKPATPAAVGRDPRPPSPPWYGAIGTGLIGLMAVILLTYTLLDIPWQQAIGGWNYVIVLVLIVVDSALMRFWRADTRRLS